MREARALELTVFVSALDVMAALGCSRATAYAHLRRAARRERGAGLRILQKWRTQR